VSGLENARIAAGPLGVPGADLTEQLVRNLTLVNVTTGQTPRVQRAGLCLADELFASVVSIAPLSMSDDARFRSRASRCSLVRRSWRPA